MFAWTLSPKVGTALGDGESLAQKWQMPLWLPCAVGVKGSAEAHNFYLQAEHIMFEMPPVSRTTCCRGWSLSWGGGQKPVCCCCLWKWQEFSCN